MLVMVLDGTFYTAYETRVDYLVSFHKKHRLLALDILRLIRPFSRVHIDTVEQKTVDRIGGRLIMLSCYFVNMNDVPNPQ